MPDERCEIEKLKVELSSFKEFCKERWDREDEYLVEFKKNLHDVSENLQKVSDSLQVVKDNQNGQVKFIAGCVATATVIFGSAWAIFTYFFQK